MHAIAKQQVKLTQDSLNRQRTIEPECLEVKIIQPDLSVLIFFLLLPLVLPYSFHFIAVHFYFKIND